MYIEPYMQSIKTNYTKRILTEQRQISKCYHFCIKATTCKV